MLGKKILNHVAGMCVLCIGGPAPLARLLDQALLPPFMLFHSPVKLPELSWFTLGNQTVQHTLQVKHVADMVSTPAAIVAVVIDGDASAFPMLLGHFLGFFAIHECSV